MSCKEMEHKNKEIIKVVAAADPNKPAQLIKSPLLPKNCVAYVGNTPIVLGKQLIVQNKDKTIHTLRDGQSGCVSMKKAVQIDPSLSSSSAMSSGYITVASHMSGEPSAVQASTINSNKLGGASQMIKTIVNQKFKKQQDQPIVSAVVQRKAVNKSKKEPQAQKYEIVIDSDLKVVTSPVFAMPKKISQSEISSKASPSQSAKHAPKSNLIYNVPSSSDTGDTSKPQTVYRVQHCKTVGVTKPQETGLCFLNAKRVLPSGNLGINNQDMKNKKSSIQAQSKRIAPKPLKQSNMFIQSSSLHSVNSLKYGNALPVIPANVPLVSSSLSESRQSMVIGTIASLSPQSQSSILSALSQQARKSITALSSHRGISQTSTSLTPASRPTGKHGVAFPTMSYGPTIVYPVTNFLSKPFPALKSILSTPSISKHSLLSHSRPRFNLPIFHVQNPSMMKKISSSDEVTKIRQGNLNEKESLSNSEDYYTSFETFQKGQPVMVMRPVLESDLEKEESSTEISPAEETCVYDTVKTINTNVFHNMSLVHGVASSSDKEIQKAPKQYNQDESSLLNLKIQSVFSLASMPSIFDDTNEPEKMGNTLENELVSVSSSSNENCDMDYQSEVKTSFNIHDDEWKKHCAPAYVVLERLSFDDIEDKKMGITNVSVQCSHHCRVRTLSYLCDLNLMQCETHLRKEKPDTEKKDLTTQDTAVVNVNHTTLSKDETEKGTVHMSPCCNSFDGVIVNQENDTDTSDTAKPSKSLSSTQTAKQLRKAEQNADLYQDKEVEKGFQLKALLQDKFERGVPGTESDSGSVFSASPCLTTEEEESEKFKRDTISLKRQVEEKRCKMRIQKSRRKHPSTKTKATEGKNTATSKTLTLKAQLKVKQSGQRLPVVLGSLLRPHTAVSSQVMMNKKRNTKSIPTSASRMSSNQNSSPSLISAKTVPTAVPTFVTNCSAYSLFSTAKGQGTSQKVCSPSNSSLLSALPLTHKNTQDKAKTNTSVPLGKFYSALQSLADHFKSTGHVPQGTQFVLLKNGDSPLILKIEPESLRPENLETLKEEVAASKNRLIQVSTVSANINKPAATPTPVTLKVRHNSMSQSNLSSTVIPPKIDASLISLTSINKSSSQGLHQQVQNKQEEESAVHSSSSAANVMRTISVLTYNLSSSINSISSSSSHQSLLKDSSSSKVCKDSHTSLMHVPLTSSLLPQRKSKRATDNLSAEERTAKRRKLEEKYPLPPGVIIKCEPDSSEYDLDVNWSVTSDIQTGFVETLETGDVPTQLDCPTSSSSSSSITNATVENDDAPPVLDSMYSSGMENNSDSEVYQIDSDDDTPPLLQPMPHLTAGQYSLEDTSEISRKSATFSQPPTVQIYDSGYDSAAFVGQSSSAESLVNQQQSQSKQPAQKMSKIQQLKELLKQKELQVENMLKKRLSMPEVDLNAL